MIPIIKIFSDAYFLNSGESLPTGYSEILIVPKGENAYLYKDCQKSSLSLPKCVLVYGVQKMKFYLVKTKNGKKKNIKLPKQFIDPKGNRIFEKNEKQYQAVIRANFPSSQSLSFNYNVPHTAEIFQVPLAVPYPEISLNPNSQLLTITPAGEVDITSLSPGESQTFIYNYALCGVNYTSNNIITKKEAPRAPELIYLVLLVPHPPSSISPTEYEFIFGTTWLLSGTLFSAHKNSDGKLIGVSVPRPLPYSPPIVKINYNISLTFNFKNFKAGDEFLVISQLIIVNPNGTKVVAGSAAYYGLTLFTGVGKLSIPLSSLVYYSLPPGDNHFYVKVIIDTPSDVSFEFLYTVGNLSMTDVTGA